MRSEPTQETAQARGVSKILGRLLIVPIRGYQKFVSPLKTPRCKYYPSCSNYAIGALKIHGPLKGSVLTVWRLARCNPWSLGGVDYPPEKGKWGSGPYKQMSESELQQYWDKLDGRTRTKES